jgi:DNA-binding CsgD family transcriptional regulator/catechol 2,3-dioxygenase-like lactoylglutathione lyase family enzyme
MPTPRARGRPAHPDLLTPGGWRVVDAVRHGLRNREIALRQGVSLDAVTYHVANALHKLGLASRRDLRRWNGVRRDSHLHARKQVMEHDIKLGASGQVARTVKDIAAARAWYGDVLGLTHLCSFGPLAFFDCGGPRLFLSEGGGLASQSILYVRVDDIRSAHGSLAARRVQFTQAPHKIHRHENGQEEWMAFVSDNDNEDRPLAILSTAGP